MTGALLSLCSIPTIIYYIAGMTHFMGMMTAVNDGGAYCQLYIEWNLVGLVDKRGRTVIKMVKHWVSWQWWWWWWMKGKGQSRVL